MREGQVHCSQFHAFNNFLPIVNFFATAAAPESHRTSFFGIENYIKISVKSMFGQIAEKKLAGCCEENARNTKSEILQNERPKKKINRTHTISEV